MVPRPVLATIVSILTTLALVAFLLTPVLGLAAGGPEAAVSAPVTQAGAPKPAQQPALKPVAKPAPKTAPSSNAREPEAPALSSAHSRAVSQGHGTISKTISSIAGQSVSNGGHGTNAPIANIGDQVVYTITVTGLPAGNSNNGQIVDNFPQHMTFVSASNGGALSNGTSVTWPVTFQANGSVSVSLTLAVVSDAHCNEVLTNVAHVNGIGSDQVQVEVGCGTTTPTVTTTATATATMTTTPATGTPTATTTATATTQTPTVTTTATRVSGSLLKKVVSVDGHAPSLNGSGVAIVNPGSTITYEITATGEPLGRTHGQIEDVLPSGLTFVSATPPPSQISGNTLIWNETFTPNGTINIFVTVRVDSNVGCGAILTNMATIPGAYISFSVPVQVVCAGTTTPTSTSTATGTATATATPTMTPTVTTTATRVSGSLVKSVISVDGSAPVFNGSGQAIVHPGSTIVYEIKVTGEPLGRTSGQIEDVLPNGVTFVSSAPPPSQISGNTLIWDETFTPTGTVTIDVTVTVDDSVGCGAILPNLATIPGAYISFTVEVQVVCLTSTTPTATATMTSTAVTSTTATPTATATATTTAVTSTTATTTPTASATATTTAVTSATSTPTATATMTATAITSVTSTATSTPTATATTTGPLVQVPTPTSTGTVISSPPGPGPSSSATPTPTGTVISSPPGPGPSSSATATPTSTAVTSSPSSPSSPSGPTSPSGGTSAPSTGSSAPTTGGVVSSPPTSGAPSTTSAPSGVISSPPIPAPQAPSVIGLGVSRLPRTGGLDPAVLILLGGAALGVGYRMRKRRR